MINEKTVAPINGKIVGAKIGARADQEVAEGYKNVFHSIDPGLVRNLTRLGINRLTAAQRYSIGVFKSGKSVAVEAPPGSGKSVAVIILALERILSNPSNGRIVCITESQLEASELYKRMKAMSRSMDVNYKLMGDVSEYSKDLAAECADTQIIIGHIRAIRDLIRLSILSLGTLDMVIFDFTAGEHVKSYPELVDGIVTGKRRKRVMVAFMRSFDILGVTNNMKGLVGEFDKRFRINYLPRGQLPDPNLSLDFESFDLSKDLAQCLVRKIPLIPKWGGILLDALTTIIDGCSVIIGHRYAFATISTLVISALQVIRQTSFTCQVLVCAFSRDVAMNFMEFMNRIIDKSKFKALMVGFGVGNTTPNEKIVGMHIIVGSPVAISNYEKLRLLSLKKVRTLLVLDGERLCLTKKFEYQKSITSLKSVILKLNPKVQVVAATTDHVSEVTSTLASANGAPPPLLFLYNIPTETTPAPLPEVASTPIPKVASAPLPKVESAPLPKVESAPLPKVESAPLPKAEPEPLFKATPTPLFKATPTPLFNATPTPLFKATPTPLFKATPTPTPSVVPPLPVNGSAHHDPPDFDSFSLKPLLLRGILDYGITVPSSIQLMSIPRLIAGHSANLCAPKNSGKSTALAIASLHITDSSLPLTQAIICFPKTSDATRMKVFLSVIGAHLNVTPFLVTAPCYDNFDLLSSYQPHVILGSLSDVAVVLSSKILLLSHVKIFAIDESDAVGLSTKNADLISAVISLFPRKPQVVVITTNNA